MVEHNPEQVIGVLYLDETRAILLITAIHSTHTKNQYINSMSQVIVIILTNNIYYLFGYTKKNGLSNILQEDNREYIMIKS